MRKLLLYTLSLLLFSIPAIAGDTTAARSVPIFAVSPEERAWLRYLEYTNVFDRAMVEYTFGEVELEAGGERSRVNLRSMPDPRAFQNGLGQGIQTDLLQYGRTEDFTIPDEPAAKVHFYRCLMTSGFCNPDPTGPGSNGNGGFAEWDVLDRSEFVVQVLRASDGALLGTLDSVGMAPHNKPHSLPRYGTNAGAILQTVALPGAARGETVYLQVSARRTGPSEYGVRVMERKNPWTMSSVENSAGFLLMNRGLFIPYSDAVFAYCDSMVRETGWLPNVGEFEFNDSTYSVFRDRYLEPYYMEGELQGYREKGSGNERRPTPEGASVRYKQARPAQMNNVVPNPLSGDVLAFELTTWASKLFLVVLYDNVGNRIAEVWRGKPAVGDERHELDLSGLNLASGAYTLRLESPTGILIGGRRFVVQH